jgi:hypothetical protein
MQRQPNGRAWQYGRVTSVLTLHPQARAEGRRAAACPKHERGLLAVLAGVLLGHAALLALWPSAPGSGRHGDTGRPLQVRQITLAPAPFDARQAPRPAQRPLAHPSTPRPARQPTTSPAAASPWPLTSTEPAPAAARAAADSEEAAAEAAGAAVPVYATRLPPSTSLRYAWRRGAVAGHAELRWQIDDRQYRLSLRNEAAGALNLGSASSGAVDAHGLAPERHTESRRGRELRAANFQRQAARITFSGPQGEVPLVAGAQDRLSWMLQLAGIAEANPALRAPGSTIAVFVVGTRGDAEVWHCTVVGSEPIELPAGAVPDALHLRRVGLRLYDTTVDVWLDPARHHLPVRAQLLVRPTGQGSELSLESLSSP